MAPLYQLNSYEFNCRKEKAPSRVLFYVNLIVYVFWCVENLYFDGLIFDRLFWLKLHFKSLVS